MHAGILTMDHIGNIITLVGKDDDTWTIKGELARVSHYLGTYDNKPANMTRLTLTVYPARQKHVIELEVTSLTTVTVATR